MREVGIGVIGLGRLGHVHAHHASSRIPEAHLAAVCDIQRHLAEAVAEELGCRWYTDARALVDDPEVDAVVVATPTGFHFEPVRAVAASGKPLFCEKPLAGSLADNEELARTITTAGLRFQVGFNRRFDPSYLHAKRVIDAGEIGDPVHFSSISRDPFPPPPWACDPHAGGGLFIDMMLHDFDLARFLMGSEVVRVFADETALVVDGGGVERFADNVTAHLRFSDGALGSCHASMHARYGYDIRTEIYGSSGTLMIGGLSRDEVTVCREGGGVAKPSTYLPEGEHVHFLLRFQESYLAELRHFAQCVLEERDPAVTVADALAAFRLAAAAIDSAAAGHPIET